MNIVIISDLHVGSESALSLYPRNDTQRSLLKAYKACIKAWARPDMLIVNGDLVDGCQVLDMQSVKRTIPEQWREAHELLCMWGAKDHVLVSGTPYHVDTGAVSVEEIVHDLLTAEGRKSTYCRKFKAILNGWFRLECRHKINSSNIPWGRFAASARVKFWNVLTSALESYRSGEKAQWPHLYTFSHVHYFSYSEDGFGAAMTTPCWQGLGSRYGDEACAGNIDVGAVRLQVGDRLNWSWQKRLYPVNRSARWVHR